jgi:hypothetical protein
VDRGRKYDVSYFPRSKVDDWGGNMSTAKRPGLPRYLRKPLIARTALRLPPNTVPVLIRTVAFLPTYQRKRLH